MLLAFSSSAPSSAQDDPSLIKSLATNRYLLAQSRVEYLKLRNEEEKTPTNDLVRKVDDLRYKIQVLNEDKQRLMALLPEEKQAYELMKDVLMKEASIQLFIVSELGLRIQEAPAGSPSLPEPKPEIPITKLHEKALDYVSQHRYDEASRIYEEIILRNPDDDQAYLILGHICLLSGQFSKAEEAFNSAVHIDSENLNEIVPFYENIVIQNPDDDVAYANLGYAYLILGDFLKAKDAFKTALNINGDNILALKGMRIIEGP